MVKLAIRDRLDYVTGKVYRTCRMCKLEFLLTPQYFHNNSACCGGLDMLCRECAAQKWKREKQIQRDAVKPIDEKRKSITVDNAAVEREIAAAKQEAGRKFAHYDHVRQGGWAPSAPGW